jgi:hypothetical protein
MLLIFIRGELYYGKEQSKFSCPNFKINILLSDQRKGGRENFRKESFTVERSWNSCGIYLQMKFYSAIRKIEAMWFEGKWMLLEDITSEVSQAQKDKGCMFSFICWI